MSLGLYVDRWRLGTKSEREVDDLLSFCDQASITDIFLHVHEDRAVNNNWDYIGYTLANAGLKRVHLWLSRTLGRDNTWTQSKAIDIKLPTDLGTVTLPKEAEQGVVLMLDPENESATKYFLDNITNLMLSYPSVYGIHLDTMNAKSEALVNAVKALTLGKWLSVTFSPVNYFCRNWAINEPIPMLVSGFSETQLDIDFTGFQSVALGCFNCDLATTTSRVRKLKALGVTPILYSYGAYSLKPQETRADFIRAINDAN